LLAGAAGRRALDHLDWAREDDGGGAAVPLRRDFEDHQHAEESTVEDIMKAYIESWKVGLKAVAIYRDNSKRSQPLNAGGKREKSRRSRDNRGTNARELFARQQREKMPVERAS